MKWKKLRSSTRTILTNANFQFSFYELGKNWKDQRPTFKNPNFEFNDKLKNTVSQFEFHC